MFTSMMKDWISFTYLNEYLHCVIWWLLYMPLILELIFILMVYVAICIVSLSLYIYKKINNAPEDKLNKIWDNPRSIISYMGSTLGKIVHGYEICGIENIPEGPAVLVYYHGAMTYDYYFFIFTFYRITGRFLFSVVHHFLFRLPGLKFLFEVVRCIDPTKQECVALLKKGHLLGIAPGGLREQNYSDNTYKLVWGNRKGFAQVAIDAKVPIIPMFTSNVREGYITYGNIRPMRWLYEKTGILLFPVCGLFPVKFRAYIGQPIQYDPNITAEELAEKTKIAMEALRDKHQKIPGNILRALRERFEMHDRNE
ncbi:transmembrane protein 68-like [Sceloporus undulatus]|uniref:transmembrane protein 68-like n=1 Tax=Sceloporus undulatus TaxID=8520 RepID=UPI001C4C9BD2|nr:transmembrane protein 68-like [Sceloporus undulatus]